MEPIPVGFEKARLNALRRYDILDTPPDGAFDRITAMAAKYFQVPISIVSLVDDDRIWFKSRFGIDAQQIPRDPGLCASAILDNSIYNVPNTLKDPRTLSNPLVAGKMGFRFYAAAPLRTHDGFSLGTLCIIDHKPREFAAEQLEYLKELAGIVMDQMELRLEARRRAQIEERKRAQEQYDAVNRLLAGIQIINSQLDLNTVLQSIAEEAARLVNGAPGGVGLVSGFKVTFLFLWQKGQWVETELSFRFGEGVAGRVAASGRSVIVNEPKTVEEVVFPETLSAYEVHGWMDVPIKSRDGRVIGILDVRRRESGRTFTDSDCRLVEALANQAAVAIENAEVYGRLEKLYRDEQEITRKLQDLDQMKTNFLLVASHEMRTPLAVLKGYTDALCEGYLGALTEEQQRSIETCRRMTQRLTNGCEKILEMTRVNQGRLSLCVESFDFKGLVEEIAEEFSTFTARRRQRLVLDFHDEASMPVLMDLEKMRLVVTNLLQNAVKFTPDEGWIRISARTVEKRVVLSVSDSGIGIEASEIEPIFERFYTSRDAQRHTSGQFEFSARGFGLGLAIARSFVEAHGGRIWAESPGRNRGSVFRVELPVGNLPSNE